MDYKEEQQGEIEALEAIYSEELTMVSEDPYVFDVFVKGSNEDTRDEEEITVYATIRFTFTETYPDTSPDMEITEESENMTEDRLNDLQQHLEEEAETNIGCVMIFTLVSAAQERLLNIVDDIRKKIAYEKEQERLEQRKLEEIKYKGTPVTLENFLEWKIRFDEEMLALGKRVVIQESAKDKKLTGKQLFERDSTLNESDIKFLTDTGVKVDESLFQDFDDLDLDEDFDEDE